jgi:hypothetical protein
MTADIDSFRTWSVWLGTPDFGPSGHIDALNPAPLTYSAPSILGQAQATLFACPVGRMTMLMLARQSEDEEEELEAHWVVLEALVDRVFGDNVDQHDYVSVLRSPKTRRWLEPVCPRERVNW